MDADCSAMREAAAAAAAAATATGGGKGDHGGSMGDVFRARYAQIGRHLDS